MATLDHVQPRINHLALLAGVLAAAFFVGIILLDFYWIPLVVFAALVIWGAILSNWKAGIYGLIGYLPFAGIPTILLYPAPTITLLVKDFLFVIPTYLSFIIWYARKSNKTPLFFPGAPVRLFAALAGILCIHLFNPKLTHLLVGLVGLKVWLLYIPLYFLGYHLIDSKERLFQIARVILFIGMIPVAIGLLEAFLIYAGRHDVVYSFYGPAARAVTMEFWGNVVGTGQSFVKISSTFTFATQYWTFLLAMFPISYALWMKSKLKGQQRNLWYLVFLGLIALAGISSGSRAAFVLTPCYYLLVVVLGRNWAQSWKPAVMFAGALIIMATLLDTTLNDLFGYTRDVSIFYASKEGGIFLEHSRVLEVTRIGLGPGMSTGPARYAVDLLGLTSGFVGFEGFYAKTIVEIGVPGLIIVVALFTSLLIAGYRTFGRLHDRALRAFGAGILAFLFLEVVYLVKGAFLDIDPLNVYFWLFAGILMKLPKLDAIEGYSQGGQPAH
jgi:hypothetical protein